jgi:ubiquinone/menaquinone biosynthesis C-methylase UbiE
MPASARFPAPPPRAPIDVRELIAGMSEEEIRVAADGYFSGLSVDSEQCHKPFSNVADAIHIHRNLALLLEAAELFPGARVLDFGCATGWLTMSLASLPCDAVGVDVSEAALALASELRTTRRIRPGGRAQFVAYSGGRVPFEDASFDRIVCFDAFHHVRSQEETLAEFARILRPGGRIAMLEPGPEHSRTAQSQMEMSLYRVIENDIDMASIAKAARAAGLDKPEMLLQLAVPVRVPVDDYLRWARRGGPGRFDAQAILSRFARTMTNTQCFFISKPGKERRDSREAGGLAARIAFRSVEFLPQSRELVAEIEVTNTGEATWLASPGQVGDVCLGVQLRAGDGTLLNRDYMRVRLDAMDAPPGSTQTVNVRVPLPAGVGALVFDLVSELVTWFSDAGRTAALQWKDDSQG